MKKIIPWLFLILSFSFLGTSLFEKNKSEFDILSFKKIPVLYQGRIKPIDTVARNALLIIHGKQSLSSSGQVAIEWLLDVFAHPLKADAAPIFLLNNPDVKSILGIKSIKQKYFSFNELKPYLDNIMKQTEAAKQYEKKLWSPYQKTISNLNDHITFYFRLRNSLFVNDETELEKSFDQELAILKKGLLVHQQFNEGEISDGIKQIARKFFTLINKIEFMDRVTLLSVLPPTDASNPDWITIAQGYRDIIHSEKPHPSIRQFAKIFDAYHEGRAQDFNQFVQEHHSIVGGLNPKVISKSKYESSFNHFQPFYKSIILYLVSFILILISWLGWEKPLSKAAFYLLVLSFSVHTLGLVSRIILQGRPPVTNLYSSAVFVGWIAIILGIILELIFRNRFGTLVASTIGFTTLIIAHHLSLQGDTLQMMQAVLDSNFWLATHVITITMGYGSTFLSGTIGLIYIFRGLFTKGLTEEQSLDLHRMVYGIICFNLLFSFVGTVLGGIWADQSWGRFWGWDPKENGALLIVLWNIIILHALKAEIIGTRGLMLTAVFGNIITSFSWFGVNMLGIGLHSYGFMDKALFWLLFFIATQSIAIALGLIPLKNWRSFERLKPSIMNSSTSI